MRLAVHEQSKHLAAIRAGAFRRRNRRDLTTSPRVAFMPTIAATVALASAVVAVNERDEQERQVREHIEKGNKSYASRLTNNFGWDALKRVAVGLRALSRPSSRKTRASRSV